jgi:hypothetical protein
MPSDIHARWYDVDMPPNDQLKEILRLTQENNKMLHKMRRGAFMKSMVQLVVYALLLIIPAYFYVQYLHPVITQLTNTVQQIQGTGAQAQAQFSGLQDMWRAFSEKFSVPTTTDQ